MVSVEDANRIRDEFRRELEEKFTNEMVKPRLEIQEAKKGHKGMFRFTTADQVIEELKPSPVRWVQLAAFVIETAEGPGKYPTRSPARL